MYNEELKELNAAWSKKDHPFCPQNNWKNIITSARGVAHTMIYKAIKNWGPKDTKPGFLWVYEFNCSMRRIHLEVDKILPIDALDYQFYITYLLYILVHVVPDLNDPKYLKPFGKHQYQKQKESGANKPSPADAICKKLMQDRILVQQRGSMPLAKVTGLEVKRMFITSMPAPVTKYFEENWNRNPPDADT